jgi:hypothetical protein
MSQICDMGQTTLLSLRRKACCGVFRPKNPTASAGFFLPYFVRVVYFVSLVLFWYLDEGLRAVDFSIMKNPMASVGSEPAISGSRGQPANP